MRKVTLQDIADQLGLTKVSVSKALNGRPGISADTRRRVMETAERLGYRGKQKDLPQEVPLRYALIVPERFFLETNGLHTEVSYHLSKLCAHDGHQLYSLALSREQERAVRLPEPLGRVLFDGIFLLGEVEGPYLRALCEKQAADLVAIDFAPERAPVDSVRVDNYDLGFRAARFLLEKGHRRIGFAGDVRQSSAVLDRYFGYLKALTLAGLPPRPTWQIEIRDDKANAPFAVPLPEEMPTAFVCQSDLIAYSLLEALRGAGKRVPQDVSLVGFDNAPLCAHTSPPLTTFEINRHDIAMAAYACMADRRRARGGRRVFLPCPFVERGSVADRAAS